MAPGEVQARYSEKMISGGKKEVVSWLAKKTQNILGHYQETNSAVNSNNKIGNFKFIVGSITIKNFFGHDQLLPSTPGALFGNQPQLQPECDLAATALSEYIYTHPNSREAQIPEKTTKKFKAELKTLASKPELGTRRQKETTVNTYVNAFLLGPPNLSRLVKSYFDPKKGYDLKIGYRRIRNKDFESALDVPQATYPKVLPLYCCAHCGAPHLTTRALQQHLSASRCCTKAESNAQRKDAKEEARIRRKAEGS